MYITYIYIYNICIYITCIGLGVKPSIVKVLVAMLGEGDSKRVRDEPLLLSRCASRVAACKDHDVLACLSLLSAFHTSSSLLYAMREREREITIDIETSKENVKALMGSLKQHVWLCNINIDHLHDVHEGIIVYMYIYIYNASFFLLAHLMSSLPFSYPLSFSIYALVIYIYIYICMYVGLYVFMYASIYLSRSFSNVDS